MSNLAGIEADVWEAMAARLDERLAWALAHDKHVIRSIAAGAQLAWRTDVFGRRVEDVCAGL